MVVLARQDLIKDTPFLHLDLISCRNLMIYMNAGLQDKLLSLFQFSLNPNGLLFLGKSESINKRLDLFKVVDNKWRIYRRKDAQSARLPRLMHNRHIAQLATHRANARKKQDTGGRSETKMFDALLDLMGNCTVVADENGTIVYIRGPVETYLKFPQGQVRETLNLLDVARPEIRYVLQSMLHKAGKEDQSQTSNRIALAGDEQGVQIRIGQAHLGGPVPHRLIVFSPVAMPRGVPPDESAHEERDHARIRELEQELEVTREHLQDTVEELETSSEELQSLNEELQSANEELQASNEELETSNEELQASNEELNTVNDELRAKSEEAHELLEDFKASEEIKRLADKVSRQALFYETVLAAVRDFVYIFDRENRFVFANARLLELWGLTLDQVIGKRMRELDYPSDVEQTLHEGIRQVLETGQTVRNETYYPSRATGKAAYYENILAPMVDADGKIEHVVGSSRDITKRKEDEEALRENHQEISEFNYALTHNVKAPFRAIQNYVQFLLEDMGDTIEGEPRQFLDGLKKAAGLANQQFEDLETLYRIKGHPLEFESLDMRQMLAEIAAIHNQRTDRELVIESQWPTLTGERFLLRQILSELISNGFKYNQFEIGKVEVGWQCPADERFEIFVRDNGIGIEPQYHDHIFHIFKRLHTEEEYDGTGIGLSIVRRAVKMIGGTLRVESIAGEGRTFVISLPAKYVKKNQS